MNTYKKRCYKNSKIKNNNSYNYYLSLNMNIIIVILIIKHPQRKTINKIYYFRICNLGTIILFKYVIIMSI